MKCSDIKSVQVMLRCEESGRSEKQEEWDGKAISRRLHVRALTHTNRFTVTQQSVFTFTAYLQHTIRFFFHKNKKNLPEKTINYWGADDKVREMELVIGGGGGTMAWGRQEPTRALRPLRADDSVYCNSGLNEVFGKLGAPPTKRR